MGGRDGETADLQYFDPVEMPPLAMPYPTYLLTNRQVSQVYFDWQGE